ncbi:hypothetical protein B0H21DRAFT_526243 [Amylocystis lapponica]|nr:hypothetical protein B0H21DRAFT_526243 [Amylocystis lapponica]
MLTQTTMPHLRSLRNRRAYPALSDDSTALLFGPGGQVSVASQGNEDNLGGEPEDQYQLAPQDRPPSDSQDNTSPMQSPPGAATKLSSIVSQPSAPADQTTYLVAVKSSQSTPGPSIAALSVTSSSGLSITTLSPSNNAASSSTFSAGFSSASSVSSSTPSSATATSTSRVNAASSGASTHDTSVYIGIAFGAIAGIAFLTALLTWWLRSRKRSRRRALENATIWPWDRDSPGGGGGGADRDFLESGSMFHGGLGLWDAGEKGPETIGEQHDPPLQTEGHSTGFSLHDGHAYPLPPAPAHIGARLAGPYPTVQVHGANGSVPDLAQDLGPLQVTNLMPGDVLSSDGSRASSALGMAPTEYGTPYPLMAGERPRYVGVDRGLPVPWAPLQLRRHDSGAKSSIAGSQKDWAPLPYPGDSSSADRALDTESWTSSLRSNLVSAFNAVVGAGSGQDAEADTLTRPPRRKQRSRGSAHQRSVAPRVGTLSRATTVQSIRSAVKEWTMEETGDGAGVVHTRLPDVAEDTSTEWFPDGLGADVRKPPVALLASQGRTHLSASLAGSLTRASSLYSAVSPEMSKLRVDAEPPRLPDIPPMSRTSSEMSTTEGRPACSQHSSKRRNTKFQKYDTRQKTRKVRRPTMVSRASSSAVSVGSSMSRASSVCSEQLTDAEEFAKKMLRERRRRMMEMGEGRRHTRTPSRNTGRGRGT